MKTIESQKNFDTKTDLRQWLIQTAQLHHLEYLLAFDEDGVIWGRFDNTGLHLASESLSDIPEIQTPLRPKTLRQARLFGKASEVLLWATSAGFNARLLNEDNLHNDDIISETYWLWGQGMVVPGTVDSPHFTLMHEGKQGLRHAPPLPDAVDKRGGLIIKHHLDYDKETGQAYIVRSRLAGLEIVQEAKNGA